MLTLLWWVGYIRRSHVSPSMGCLCIRGMKAVQLGGHSIQDMFASWIEGGSGEAWCILVDSGPPVSRRERALSFSIGVDWGVLLYRCMQLTHRVQYQYMCRFPHFQAVLNGAQFVWAWWDLLASARASFF